ncbi:MAG: multiheme c-type cytochrome [Mariprofundales bacterium]|nr:multiheme c-type cytochrome [Mariprofundales bacterium]
MTTSLSLIALLVTVLLTVSAQSADDWLSGHWDHPQATTAISPDHWSPLEKSMHPEACAQCHQQQFDSWRLSRHARAFSAGLVGQFAAMDRVEANSCLTCHAPLGEQRFSSGGELRQSLIDLVVHPLGFDPQGDPDSVTTTLSHAGVTCASCHVRGWQRFGPPVRHQSGRIGHVDGGAHGGFTAQRDYLSSQFCASCHQFPQEYAVNGKPLENTVFEWEQSRFARAGVSCQQCHMPDRNHLFRGIHDVGMVLSGVEIAQHAVAGGAELTLHSTAVGHAFPTYVTPQIVITAEAFDAQHESLRRWRWRVGREVEYDGGWQEISDSRIMPGERRSFIAADAPTDSYTIHFEITVIPDHLYKGVYRSMLADSDITPPARTLLQRALDSAEANDYRLYSGDTVVGSTAEP